MYEMVEILTVILIWHLLSAIYLDEYLATKNSVCTCTHSPAFVSFSQGFNYSLGNSPCFATLKNHNFLPLGWILLRKVAYASFAPSTLLRNWISVNISNWQEVRAYLDQGVLAPWVGRGPAPAFLAIYRQKWGHLFSGPRHSIAHSTNV